MALQHQFLADCEAELVFASYEMLEMSLRSNNNNNNNMMPFTTIVNSTYCNKDKSRCEIWKCDCRVGAWKPVPHSVVFVSLEATASALFAQEGDKTVCFLPSA